LTYSYRSAEQNDKEAIFRLYRLVVRRYVAEIWGWHEEWQENDFYTRFDPKDITLVNEGQDLVGYSHVENWCNQLYVRMIVLHPHHQGKGIGGKLLGSVIALGKEQSKRIGLQVFKINDKAIKFYESHGFRIEAETVNSFIMGLMPDNQVKGEVT
jgi:ribosomal protein S18 acetylase RimI-like enzyme